MRFEKVRVEDAQANDTAAELEEVEVGAPEVVDDARVGVDLERVVVVRGEFKESVVGAENLFREEEEELSAIKRGSARSHRWRERNTHLESPPASRPSSSLNEILSRRLSFAGRWSMIWS